MVMITPCTCDLGVDSTQNARSVKSVLGRDERTTGCAAVDRTGLQESVPLLPHILHLAFVPMASLSHKFCVCLEPSWP